MRKPGEVDSMAEEYTECPICFYRLPLSGLERHVNDHLDEDEHNSDRVLAHQLASTSQSSFEEAKDTIAMTVRCSECSGYEVPLKDWENHCLLHELQAQEESEGWKSIGSESKAGCSATEGRGAGASGQRRGWIVSAEAEIKALMTTQSKAIYNVVEEGIMNLLRQCLELEEQGLSCSTISGHVDHFESRASEDIGWGCGWRNIQMLSSHLIAQKWGAKEVLFGGVGFVPNIPALQHWLEIAWDQGFDKTGAEMYNQKIRGSKAWIGTTECAALFRSFGLYARIVDFSSSSSKLAKDGIGPIKRWLQQGSNSSFQRQRVQSANVPINVPVHYNVQCDVCGVYPIKGTRFQSTRRNDFDLCSDCMNSRRESPDHYKKIEKPVNLDCGVIGKEVASDEDINHQSLVDWVWEYFTGGLKHASSRTSWESLQGRVITSSRTPLYFQHQGHSRTIVGMQRRRKSIRAQEEVFLLVLDPSLPTHELARALRRKAQWQKLIKRGVHTLKKNAYQVCYIEPGIANGDELEQLKVLSSELHSY